jgi:hypothetical protein
MNEWECNHEKKSAWFLNRHFLFCCCNSAIKYNECIGALKVDFLDFAILLELVSEIILIGSTREVSDVDLWISRWRRRHDWLWKIDCFKAIYLSYYSELPNEM